MSSEIGPVAAIALLFRFLLELAMLAALGYAGWELGDGGGTGFALGAVFVLIAISLWGAFVAPKASRRLDPAPRVVLEVVLFGAAAAGLVASGSAVSGISLAVLYVVDTALVYGLHADSADLGAGA